MVRTMVECSSCGMLINTFECPICGYVNRCAHSQDKNAAPPKEEPPGQPLRKRRGPEDLPPLRNKYMLSGTMGAFLIALAAVISSCMILYNIIENNRIVSFSSGNYLVMVLSSLVLMAGCFMAGIGFYGLYRHYRSNSSLATMVFLVAAPLIYIFFIVMTVFNERYDWYGRYDMGFQIWIAHIFLGIMFVMVGNSLIHLGVRPGLYSANKIPGILFIISGVLFFVFQGFFGYPWILVTLAAVIAGTQFYIARPYAPHLVEQHPPPYNWQY